MLSAAEHAIGAGLLESLNLLWESLYGLTLGFLISAIVQVAVTEQIIRRYASDTLGGVAAMAGFGVISSSCSYAAAAVGRSLYRRGAGPRAAFAYMISSTNMNVAILILFWVLVGWKFALAEFLGGIVIIAVVVTGLSLLFSREALERLRAAAPREELGDVVTEDVVCGMEGSKAHAVEHEGRTYLFCNAQHARQFRAEPAEYTSRLGGGRQPDQLPLVRSASPTLDPVCGMEGSEEHVAEHEGRRYLFCSEGCRQGFWNDPGRYLGRLGPTDDGPVASAPTRPGLLALRTWYEITENFFGDVKMLRNELAVGYLIAGFAEALVPHQWLSSVLNTIGGVPVIGYALLLLLGLAIAIATFVCSMGNVPVAQFLEAAGVPLGANIAYIYGDLLILPLVQIYRRSFAPRLVAAYLGLFIVGACAAGALMEQLISRLPGGV